MNDITNITERKEEAVNCSEAQQAFKSLDDIERRKRELLKGIRRDQKEMSKLCNEFLRPQKKNTKQKGFKLSSILSSSVGVIDGALFAWKLYRKFKR